MSRTALKSWIVAILAVGTVSVVMAREANGETKAADEPKAAADVVTAKVAPETDGTAQPSANGRETAIQAADQASQPTGAASNQSTSGWAQEGTRPNTLFPAWSLQSTRNVDPRIRPNAGLRIPRSYFPIPGGPLLYPNYSPVEPDYTGGRPVTPWSVSESLGYFGVGDDHVSSKFQEFRDVRSGVTGGVEGHYREDNTIFNMYSREIGRGDQDTVIDGGVAGKFLYSLSYNETPHNYAFGAKSLYSGIGTTALTLPDSMQADLQNSTSLAQLAAKMLGYVNSNAQSIDEATVRQNFGGELTLLTTYPWVIKVAASNESRDGIRPWSGSFGFSNFVEIPWPVKYDTREFRVTAEYAKPESRIYANASVRVSDFVDHIESFTFDNPDRVVNAAGALGCTFLCGPSMGRMTLYPSNRYYEVSTTESVRKLPFNSTFNAVVSVGFMRQNENLVPFSTNSADPLMNSPVNPSFNATDPAGLPRQTAEAAMNTQTVSLKWTSDLSPKARLTAQYRFYGLDNNEKQFTINEFVREDEDIRLPETLGGTYQTVPAQFSKNTASLEGTYQISPLAKLTGVYTFERMSRDFREVKRMDDNKFKAEYDTVALGSIEFKTWYEHTQRTTSSYEFDQYNIVQGNPNGHPMFPFIEKFDEMPFSRNEAQAMATYAFNDSSSLSTHLQFLNTDYNVTPLGQLSMLAEHVTTQVSDAMQFGVRNDRRYSIGVDYTYAPTPRLTAFAEAGYERQQYESMSRQWTVNGISDPYLKQTTLASNSNWIAHVRDNYFTAGIGGEFSFIPDKLKLTLQYVFSKSDGQQAYSSPVGTAADDTNPFVPIPFNDVDDTTTISVNPELTYKYSPRLSLAAGYQFEQWHVNDYNYQGFTYAPVFNAGVALLMGGLLPKPYSQNIAYVRVKMGF